ncbi:MAG: hypothetical protein M3Z22_07260 [Verrucomicrobiota bacterium]|nr:hypothetical protein [Verrucomicrobiota bacterium]
MKTAWQIGLSVFLSVSLLSRGVATSAPNERGLTALNVIPTEVLRRSISPRFYKSLLISPLKGSVLVRATLSGATITEAKVVHSELNGLYDSLALDLAKKTKIAGYYGIESRVPPSVLLHLLIYEIADGTMVLSFVNFDGAGGNQMDYYGCAKLMVHKNDGSWTEIMGPPSLQGKGYAVRQGLKNDFELQAKYALRIVPGGG